MSRHKAIWRKPIISRHQFWKAKQFWRRRGKVFKWVVGLLLLALVLAIAYQLMPSSEVIEKTEIETKKVIVEKETIIEKPTYTLVGTDAHVVGNYGNGVSWDGKFMQSVSGTVNVNLDPKKLGTVRVHLEGARINTEDKTVLEDDDIDILFTEFDGVKGIDKGVIEGIDVFGETGKLGEFYPKMHAYLGAFGKAEVRLGNQVVYDELHAMMLYSDGIRKDGQIISKDEQIFSQKLNNLAYADKKDREIHVILFDPIEDKKNFPRYNVWINIFFEEVEVESAPKNAKI